MRVAFAGAHWTGKTSLIEAVAESLPTYEVVPEPYRLLEDDGYEFSDPPTTEDFAAQLRRSIATIAAAPADALVDRCPLDFVAYLRDIDPAFDLDDWIEDIRDTIERLDLIVVVPIETPDRIAVPGHEDLGFRRRIDQLVHELAVDDSLGLGATTVEVSGRLADRARDVVRAITARSAPSSPGRTPWSRRKGS